MEKKRERKSENERTIFEKKKIATDFRDWVSEKGERKLEKRI